MVVINKCDISEEGLKGIEKYCKETNLEVALRIPFNRSIVESISDKKIPSIENKDFFNKIGFESFVAKVKS